MIHRFGSVEVDEARREVRRGGAPVVPGAKVLDLLLHLIRHRDRIVPRSELLDQFWVDEDVSEGALSACAHRARQLVHGSATIRTFARRGFRFVGTISHPPTSARPRALPFPHTDLVGRNADAARLFRLADDLFAGRSGVALISGEAGIGKTRLLDELVRHARARGVEALVAKCGEGTTPFAPWQRVIAAYVAARDGDKIRAALGPGAAALARFTPALRRRRRVRTPAPDDDPEQARAQLFDAVTSFLLRVAAQRPIMLVFDDLHWADPSSLLLLKMVARALPDDPLLIAATYRDVAADAAAPLSIALDVLRRVPHLEQVALGPLGEVEVRALLHQLGDTELPAPLIDAIVAKAEGNPLFIGEYWRHLGGGNGKSAAADTQVSLPTTIDALIGSRLDALTPPCRAMVDVAAVLGREFDYHLLARTSGCADDRLLDALDEAAHQRIVSPVRGVPDRYRFAHALIRDAAYQRLGAATRQTLHRQAGESLEQLFGSDLEAQLPELSYHFTQAGEAGDVEKGIAYTTRAGEWAHAQLAYEEAARYFEQALAGLERYRPHLRSHRRDLQISCGEAYLHAGQTARAAAAYALVDGPPHEASPAVSPDDAAVLPGDRTAPPLPQSRLLTRINFMLHLNEESLAGESWRDVRLRREVHTRIAVERARRRGDPAALASALSDRRWAAMGPHFLRQRLALSTEWVDVAEELGDVDMVQEARLFRISDLIERGRIDAADAAIAAYARVGERHPQPVYLWVLTYLRAMRAQLVGDFEPAEQLAQDAYARGLSVAGEIAQQIFSVQIAMQRAAQGRSAEMADLLEMLAQQLPNMLPVRIALAAIYCLQGRLDEGRREFEVLAADDFAGIEAQQSTWITSATALVHPCVALGDHARAESLYDKLSPLADSCVVSGLACGYNGAVAGYLGGLAQLLGRFEDATSHFERALEINTRMGARPVLAHTQLAYARFLLETNRRGTRKRAMALLDAAADTAARLGIPGLTAQVQALR